MNSENIILIIEDNPDNAHLAEVILRLHHYKYHVCHHGSEAIAYLQEHKPRLILTDLSLPDMDGYAIARFVRSLPDLNDIPIIAISGLPLESVAERIVDAEIDDYVLKP